MLLGRRFQAHNHLVYWSRWGGGGALVLLTRESVLGTNVIQTAEMLLKRETLKRVETDSCLADNILELKRL